jgi:hypothetical protein
MSRYLTLREALASDRLADFVRQAEAGGVELARGSDFERALALLITKRRSEPARPAYPTQDRLRRLRRQSRHLAVD